MFAMFFLCSLLLLSASPKTIAFPPSIASITSITSEDSSNKTIRDLPDTNASRSKRGIGGLSISYSAFQATKSHISWAYDWESIVNWNELKNLDFVPMLWGARSSDTKDWIENANYAISRGSRYLMSFNEPNESRESNLSPQAAVDVYRKYMNPFAGRAYLGAPAVSSNPDGEQWLKDFLRLCTGCHIDFVPVHFYDHYSSKLGSGLKLFVGKIHTIAGSKKIWLTEFGVIDDISVTNLDAFLGDVIPWLDSQGYVQRYAMNNQLGGLKSVFEAGHLTSPGNVYTYLADQASAPDKMK